MRIIAQLGIIWTLLSGAIAFPFEIRGTAFVAQTSNPATGVIVTLLKGNDVVNSVPTGEDGTYNFVIKESGDYRLAYKKIGHRIIVPETGVTITRDVTIAKPIRVFRKGEQFTAANIATTLQQRAAVSDNKESSIEADFEMLAKYGEVSTALLTEAKTSIEQDPKPPQKLFALKEDISIAELKAALNLGKVIVVDTRDADEFNKGSWPSAISAHDKHLAAKLPEDKKSSIVIFGYKESPQWTKTSGELRALGYSNLKTLKSEEPTASPAFK